MKIMVTAIARVFLLVIVLVFNNCSNKKYGYTYFEECEELNTVKAIPFKTNDFRINFRPTLDSVILDKDKPAPVSVMVNISGQYQNWPKDLTLEVYCNEKRLQFRDSLIKFSVSSVINDRVMYFDINAVEFDVPEIVDRTRQEHHISDSVNYYKVSCSLNSEYFVSDSNPDTMTIKVKALWKDGSETIEKTFILTKIDITKYQANPRWYG